MTDKTYGSTDSRLRYRRPEAKEIPLTVQGVLCQSGNGPMGEKDYGDGGFHNM